MEESRTRIRCNVLSCHPERSHGIQEPIVFNFEWSQESHLCSKMDFSAMLKIPIYQKLLFFDFARVDKRWTYTHLTDGMTHVFTEDLA